MLNNKVLILGGGGFIGANLARYFVSKNHSVTVFDLEKPAIPVEGVEYITGDFFDEKALGMAIHEKNIIVHAVSTVNSGNSGVRFMSGYERDLLQTVRLCSMLIGTGTRLLFLSSGGTVYGNQSEMPIKESVLPCPINHYGSIKLCIENIMRTFNIQFKTNFLIARISNPYGPGQDYLKGVGFIDAALKKALCGETIDIWGDGGIIRDYIYIDDVCKMLYSLCCYNGAESTFNISSGRGVSQNDVINILENMGLSPKVAYKPARNVDVKKIILDNTKILSIYKDGLIDISAGIEKYTKYLSK